MRDPKLTPGAIDESLNVTVLCTTSTRSRRTATSAEKRAVYKAYGIPFYKRVLYRLDDLVPLELGGINTPANLWPQPYKESKAKDADENRYRKLVCTGQIDLKEAQQYFLKHW